MPESKADLLASADEAAGLVQKVFFTYLLVSIYLAVLIGSTTHEQLLRASGVQLPLFGVPLSIFWVYAVAPWLYLALHVNLLVQHYLLSRKLHAFNRALEMPAETGQPLSIDELASWRLRLYPSLFAQALAGGERSKFKQFVLHGTVFMTVAVAPVILLLWMQIQFLPYHSEPVTWGNRIALILDLGLLWYYWPLMVSNRDSGWWRIVGHQWPAIGQARVICALLSVGVIQVSTLLAVVPGGGLERFTATTTADDWWREQAHQADQWTGGAAVAVPEDCQWALRKADDGESDRHQILISLRLWLLKRHLDVRGANLVNVEPPPQLIAALANQELALDGQNNIPEKLLQRTIGLDLKGRNLRGAILENATLTKADLSNADLHGAHLGCAKLQKAIMKKAELDDAELGGVALPSATMERAVLHNVALSRALLEKADVTNAQISFRPGLPSSPEDWPKVTKLDHVRFVGAKLARIPKEVESLFSAQLQGADLRHADLRGKDLSGANLQGADLSNANLQGATLKLAHLQGANLSEAKLAGTDFSKAKIASVDFTDATTVYDSLREERKGTPSKFDQPQGDNIFCRDETFVETGLKCVDRKTYDTGLVKELATIFCVKGETDLSAVETKALLQALRRRTENKQTASQQFRSVKTKKDLSRDLQRGRDIDREKESSEEISDEGGALTKLLMDEIYRWDGQSASDARNETNTAPRKCRGLEKLAT